MWDKVLFCLSAVSDAVYTLYLAYVKYLVYVVCDRFYRVIFCVLTHSVHIFIPMNCPRTTVSMGSLQNEMQRNGRIRSVLERERWVFWNVFLTTLCPCTVCVPAYCVIFTLSYVAFYCGQAFQFSHYILHALTVVSLSALVNKI